MFVIPLIEENGQFSEMIVQRKDAAVRRLKRPAPGQFFNAETAAKIEYDVFERETFAYAPHFKKSEQPRQVWTPQVYVDVWVHVKYARNNYDEPAPDKLRALRISEHVQANAAWLFSYGERRY